MVDKIWYDWQHHHPLNGNSFFGGSMISLESLDAFERYPNGAPPYLSVSTDHLKWKYSFLIDLRSRIRACRWTDCSQTSPSEMYWTPQAVPCVTHTSKWRFDLAITSFTGILDYLTTHGTSLLSSLPPRNVALPLLDDDWRSAEYNTVLSKCKLIDHDRTMNMPKAYRIKRSHHG